MSDTGSLYVKNVAISGGEGSCLGGGFGLFINDAAVNTKILVCLLSCPSHARGVALLFS